MLTTNQNLQQDRYRIVNQLGQNGTGAAYEAFDNKAGAAVLIKEIRDNSGKVSTPAQIEARRTSFAKKAKMLQEMKHESLLLIKDFFSEIDHHYLVTDFNAGNTLGELLEKSKKPFLPADVANWADNLLDALNYLHTLTPAVIHGEIKPQNIKMSPDGKIKLQIFNLVKNADEINAATSNQTFDAAVLPFLPLEQIWQGLDAASKKVILTNYDDKSEKILEQPADARTDVFSLAATLYYLLTARTPADALTRSIDILEGKADPLKSPTELNPSVPEAISEVLMKALEIKRENRFSSAVIMRQVLRTAVTRVKEREASSPPKNARVEDDAVLEIPVAPAKPALAAPPKSSELESEAARQLELIKQQLRQAEEQRLEAEKRAAEAEKRLLEAKKSAVAETPVKEAAKAAATGQSNESKSSAVDASAHEFSGMFAEPEKEGGAFKKIAAAAVALIVLGGGGFGIYSATQSQSAEPLRSVSTTNAALPAPSPENKPAIETTPTPNEPAIAETNPQPAEPSADAVAPASNPTAVRPKPVVATPIPQTAQAKKPAATPAKTEKKVTLDDLLKDN
ncbi:MAG TPA: protein kinase [Pyrinomonadaceae bacterium]|jgi:serine/threonine protein kinase